MFLVLTKSDMPDKKVSLSDLKSKVEEDKEANKGKKGGLKQAMKTSSKEWEDFNVHKAFNKVLGHALDPKK